MTVVVDVMLAIAVGGAWLGAAGLVRLRSNLDRIHCVAFVNAVCGCSLLAAAIIEEGLSGRTLKIGLIVAASLLIGAVTAQVLARALLRRGSAAQGLGGGVFQ